MNSIWHDFLQQQGAVIQDGMVQHFGDAQGELAAAQNDTVLCDLNQFSTLKASGEDTQTFLQSMLSSDVREVTEQHAQFSSLNTPKGRMLATFLIWRSGADYFLQLPHSLCPAMHKRLSMYVLRSKVKIEDVSEQQLSLGLSGKDAASLLQTILIDAPQDEMAVTQNAQTSIIHLGQQRYQINTTRQHAPVLWQSLSSGARPAGSACWDWLIIRAGVPVITPATQEQFVAQMTNLELIGGVNFKKGCYPGQEIVARTHYLGKLKRRMYLAHLGGNTPPQAGDALYSAEMEGQPSGMVVNASPAPGGGYDLLAVLQISSREAHTVHIQSLQGAALEFLPLPYTIP